MSDWSSDVCSSDLRVRRGGDRRRPGEMFGKTLELRPLQRDLREPVLRYLELGPDIAHLAPEFRHLRNGEPVLMGHHDEGVRLEGLMQFSDQGFLLRSFH